MGPAKIPAPTVDELRIQVESGRSPPEIEASLINSATVNATLKEIIAVSLQLLVEKENTVRQLTKQVSDLQRAADWGDDFKTPSKSAAAASTQQQQHLANAAAAPVPAADATSQQQQQQQQVSEKLLSSSSQSAV